MILYLDTSSLAKLYVYEAFSDDVRALVEAAQVVTTSRVAYPEMRAALARRRRDRTLRPRDFAEARRAFEAEWSSYLVLEVTAAICQDAGDLAERYGLRGFDGIHLASFADVARGAAGAEVRFSSFDTRLNRAARLLTRARRA